MKKRFFISKLIKEWLKKKRQYASYFEARSKERKEIAVTKKWLKALANSDIYITNSLEAVNDQWPDCKIKLATSDKTAEYVGIEVTELVDSQYCGLENSHSTASNSSIKNNAPKDPFRIWSDQEIIDAINERLQKKNLSTHGGKYKKLIVLIHTDEIEITYDRRHKQISNHKFKNLKNIDEAYIVYSHDPVYGKCPVSKLNIEK